MSNDSGRGMRRRARPPGEEGSGPADAIRKDQQPVPLRNSASLERLRDRIELATHELRRLREENTALAERIRDLEGRPVEHQETPLQIDHDPEILRLKIDGFIEAIDRYLGKDR
jgi:hypothetical protein